MFGPSSLSYARISSSVSGSSPGTPVEEGVSHYEEVKQDLMMKDAPCAQKAFDQMLLTPPLSPGQKPSEYPVKLTAWIPKTCDHDSFFYMSPVYQ